MYEDAPGFKQRSGRKAKEQPGAQETVWEKAKESEVHSIRRMQKETAPTRPPPPTPLSPFPHPHLNGAAVKAK